MSETDAHRNAITLTRFILNESHSFTNSTGEFAMLLQSIQLACKAISNACRKLGVAQLHGVSDDKAENKSGDVQKKLDVFSNDVFVNCLRYSQQIFVMGSEEDEHPIVLNEEKGGYAIVFDPLDGSSNIDANISVGTIFGIYKKAPHAAGKPGEQDLLRPGNELICAGYALYGSATMIVLSTGNGVNGFMLDPSLGEFILTHPNIKMPTKGDIYSCNEGNYLNWDKPVQQYVDECKKKGKKARYVGSMVADIHRTLLYGGIFFYPADKKAKEGKLRLLYECNPIAFIMEQAGGSASTGTQRVLDVKPKKLHGRCPIVCGSKEDVAEYEKLVKAQLPSKL